MTRIIPDPAVDPQVLMALQLVRAFIPPSLRELRVEVLAPVEEGATLNLAEFHQHSGYMEATLLVAPELSQESPESILQVLLHEIAHAHLHQLDELFHAMAIALPNKRARRATTMIYKTMREAAADGISYAVGDLLRANKPKEHPLW